MSEPIRFSPDGETWYELTHEQFHKFLDDSTIDGWVDLPVEEGTQLITLECFRNIIARPKTEENTLYGIPVVVKGENAS